MVSRINLLNSPDGTIETKDKFQILFGLNFGVSVSVFSQPFTALLGSLKVSAAEEREHELPLFCKRFVRVISDSQMIADYDARTDGQPIYLGFGARGLSTSSSGWLIQKFTYDSDNQCDSRQIAYGTWDNKGTLTYE